MRSLFGSSNQSSSSSGEFLPGFSCILISILRFLREILVRQIKSLPFAEFYVSVEFLVLVEGDLLK